MKFRMGNDSLDMSQNALSHLNDTSPFEGSLRRWYCTGGCSGQFASVNIEGSSLATLKGCTLRMFQWIRKLFVNNYCFVRSKNNVH